MELQIAINTLTYDLVKGIKRGQTIKLTENFELYRYDFSDFICLINASKSEELYCVQYNSKTKLVELTEL